MDKTLHREMVGTCCAGDVTTVSPREDATSLAVGLTGI